jgi:hypothetical protein
MMASHQIDHHHLSQLGANALYAVEKGSSVHHLDTCSAGHDFLTSS